MGESSSSTQWTQEYSTSDSIDDDLQFPSSFSSPLAEWDNNEFSENPQEIPWNQLLMSESTVMHGDMVVDSRYSCYPLIGSAATEDRGQYQTMEEFPSPSIQWPDDSTTIDPVRILPPDDFLNFDYPFLADTAADHTTNHRTGLLSDVVNFDLQPMRRDAAVSLPAPPVDLPQREAGTTTNGGAKSLEAKTRKRWTLEEHWRFLMGLKEYGSGDWKKISKNFVTSRSSTQVASHAQKFFLRQQHCSPREKRKRKSIHDYSTEDLDFLTQLLANRNQPEDHQPSTSNFPIIQPSFPQPPPPFHQTEYHQPSRNYASMIQHSSTSSQSIPTQQLPSTNYLTSMMINYSPSELTYQTQYHQSSRNYASTIQHPSTSPRLLPSQQWPSTNYSTPINYLPLELAYQTQYGQPSLKYASTIQHPSTSSGSVLSQQLTSRNYSMPSQQLASSNYLVPSQQSASMSSTVLSQQLTSTNYSVPSQQLMTSTNYSIPSQQLASMSSSSPSQQLTSTNYSVPSQQLASMSSSIPSQQLAFTNYTPHGFSSMI